MTEFSRLTMKTRKVRCWNCRAVIIVPFPLDPGSIMDDIPRHIIPYSMKCPECGDSIYKYKCREESRFVH